MAQTSFIVLRSGTAEVALSRPDLSRFVMNNFARTLFQPSTSYIDFVGPLRRGEAEGFAYKPLRPLHAVRGGEA
jgi:hypothetical protein